ncbi:MAG TPA: hypothetical protein EYO62_05090 [Aquificales bacterium]|nr:hypothetical protein [Aquificales bacterium]
MEQNRLEAFKNRRNPLKIGEKINLPKDDDGFFSKRGLLFGEKSPLIGRKQSLSFWEKNTLPLMGFQRDVFINRCRAKGGNGKPFKGWRFNKSLQREKSPPKGLTP